MPKYTDAKPLNLYAADRMCRIKTLMCAPATRRRRCYAIQAPPHLELDAVLEAVTDLLWIEGIDCQVVSKQAHRAQVKVSWRRSPERDFTFKELAAADDNIEEFLAELDA
jgi:hypothetical protein